MLTKFFRHAPTALVSMHSLLWVIVVTAWLFAWRVEPAPSGPPYNSAKRLISRIDCVGSPMLDPLSFSLAHEVTRRFGTSLGLNFAIFFAVLILLVGTMQWLAVGWLMRWVAEKYGQTIASFVCIGVAIGISLAFVSWAFS